MRKPIIAGNWKMNNTASEGVALVNAIAPLVTEANCDVVVCVPAIDIPAVSAALKGTNIKLGAENVHFAEKGAYTGEISAAMLLEYGVEYVIIGHSERRQYFGETDETVNKRTLTALKAGLTPIVCIGESLEERETGQTEEKISKTLNKWLSLTNPFGLSARAKRLRQTKPTKRLRISVKRSAKCSAPNARKKFVSNTAVA